MELNSEAELEVAFANLGKLISRGGNPRLLATGKIALDSPATDTEVQWCIDHRDAFRAALVGAGRYEKGTLDRIYGIGGATMSNAQDALAELRDRALADEIEQEVSACLAGPDFAGWSGDCRKSWARSILNIIEGDKLVVKPACMAILADVAARGV